jgi:8-oxo-dGTP pyrophosphatase MutT (NUDIX family)
MNSAIKDHMVVDEQLRIEIVRRVQTANFRSDQPDQWVNSLGVITLPGGKEVSVYLRHAADAIILDNFDHVVLITRRYNPGAGLEALPGGFIDPIPDNKKGVVAEDAASTALREAREETGIDGDLLAAAVIAPIEARSYDRPFDIREAWGDMPGTPIRMGDLVAVSTQAFCIHVKKDLSGIALHSGDDATRVRVARISTLKSDIFAVPDHLPMILKAVKMYVGKQSDKLQQPYKLRRI